MSSKPLAFFDTECYPNYWLIKFMTGGLIFSYRLREGESFDAQGKRGIMAFFMNFCCVGFNSNSYDIPMIIAAALKGFTPSQLKEINDRIIVQNIKPWELGLPEWKPLDHVDLIEVAPGIASQKLYAGRIHAPHMQDLPYDPSTPLTPQQMQQIDAYCDNDLRVLAQLHEALKPQIEQREQLSERYGIDLRSKSDAQLAEAVLKLRCEQATKQRIFKTEINWNMRFQYKVPPFIQFNLPQLIAALTLVRNAQFRLGNSGAVEMPPELDSLEIIIGQSVYKLGIGGLHSQEKRAVHFSDDHHVILDNDVASYYPSLILNSGEFPAALGPAFRQEYEAIKTERLAGKARQAALKKQGDTSSDEYKRARVDNEGGKIMINGTFGKTGSPYSILFAPSMLIQTTVTGQLSLLMLIEWHEHYGIPVVSANTDGMVIKCPRQLVHISQGLIAEWQRRTGLEMETVEYAALYSRDVNNYIAVKADGSVKRKGEYGPTEPGPTAYLNEKRNPGNEICAEAVAEFLSKGIPFEHTIGACRDIRKFVTVQKVSGGAVKMWGEGPIKGKLVRDFGPELLAKGWRKEGRYWTRGDTFQQFSAHDAYKASFAPQTPEYLGKVARWYYSTMAPGPIVYHTNGNLVGNTYGARPCMTLPAEFPADIDYQWYLNKARDMLSDLGV